MRELLNSSVSIGLVFVVLVGCAISLVLLLKNKLKIQNNIKRFISFFLLFYLLIPFLNKLYSALTIIVFGVLFLISGRVA